MRGEGGVLVRGKFTPIRSGHLPPQRQVRGVYEFPRTGSEQGQRMMRGALTGDQPARVVSHGNRDGMANHNRDRQAERGTKQMKKRKREERTEKWVKNASWIIFCCGLCEDWDLAADSHQRGAQNVALGGGERR